MELLYFVVEHYFGKCNKNINLFQTTTASHSAAPVHGASAVTVGSADTAAAKERPDELNIKQLAQVSKARRSM